MSEFRNFLTQTLHYFDRPHDGVPQAVIDHPAAWDAAAMLGDRESWHYRLGDQDVAEFDRALDQVADLPMEAIGRGNFPLPGLADRIVGWRRALGQGRGFLLISGMPVDRWSEEQASRAYWGLGHHLGIPGGQNPQNELLGHVRDYGEEKDAPHVRRYRTSGDIAFHCDAADVVGLLCLRPASKGGESRIASSLSILNQLMDEAPELAERLFSPLLLDRRGEQKPGDAPVMPIQPACHHEGMVRTFWHSDYFRSAYRHEGIPPIDPLGQALLDRYDALAHDSRFCLDMDLRPGDMQFISNHTIVHARTAYEDWPEPGRERHLLRLWLSLEDNPQ